MVLDEGKTRHFVSPAEALIPFGYHLIEQCFVVFRDDGTDNPPLSTPTINIYILPCVIDRLGDNTMETKTKGNKQLNAQPDLLDAKWIWGSMYCLYLYVSGATATTLVVGTLGILGMLYVVDFVQAKWRNR